MKTVLLVDDQKRYLDLYEQFLMSFSTHQLIILKAESGYKALELIRANTIDLIISDLSMPGFDGQSFAKTVKADIKSRSIPIIMSSGFAAYSIIYADAFYCKSDPHEELVKLADDFLSQKGLTKAVNFLKIKGLFIFIMLQGMLLFGNKAYSAPPTSNPQVNQNTRNIDRNKDDIKDNKNDIRDNKKDIKGNGRDIKDNKKDIKNNKNDIKDNKKDIKGNKKDIKNNKNDIKGNGRDIEQNEIDSIHADKLEKRNRIQSDRDLDNRLGKLEETQYVIEGQARIYDGKKWKVKLFLSYSNTRNKFDTVGVKFTYKFGKSYEEKLIEEQLTRIERIENKLDIKEGESVKSAYKKAEEEMQKENLDYAERNYKMTLKENGTWVIERRN